ncbi:hypothetical protein CR513_23459, partial [Mucuna pruriens]
DCSADSWKSHVHVIYREQKESSDISKLVGYTDSDWAGDIETRKSTSRYAFHLGTGAVAWSSKKQPTIALSTAEAEYITIISCANKSA